MKFVLDFFPDCWPNRKSSQAYYKEALDLVEAADRLGFHGVKIVEHYFHPFGGYSPNPLVFLTAASQRAPHLRLLTGAVLPIFSNPIKQAGELAMLDAISGGRLDLGFARAFLPHEFTAFGIPMNESRARFNEGVEAIVRLLTEETVSYKGDFVRFENVSSLPRPVQSPPPVFIAVVKSAESFVYTGEKGYNLMVVPFLAEFDQLAENIQLYRQIYREQGFEAVKPAQVLAMQHMYVAEDGARARQEAQPYLEDHLATFIDVAGNWNNTESKDYKGYNGLQHELKKMSFERIMRENRALIGSPEEVAEKIYYLREKFGVDYLSLQCNFGMLPYEQTLRSIQLFAEKVIPLFADQPASIA